MERLVLLEDLLHAARREVVLRTNDVGVHETGRRVERVDGRVDAELGNGAGEHGRRVEVGERGRGGRVCQVIGRHVHSLH